MQVVNRATDDSRSSTERSSHARRRLVVGLAALAIVCAVILTAVTALGHYHIGQVERLDGDIATITVEELGKAFTAEVVDPDLEAGADVVLYVADGQASIVATSPGRVRLIARLKELL